MNVRNGAFFSYDVKLKNNSNKKWRGPRNEQHYYLFLPVLKLEGCLIIGGKVMFPHTLITSNDKIELY